MRADGTPIMVSGGVSTTLQRQAIGGKEGHHNERWLQRLIHRHPVSIPMDQIEPGLPTLVPICMELSLPCGYLDNLFMTPYGDIVIVEVKLFRNSQARREVVAQALDYASALFGMQYETLEEAILKSDFDGAQAPTRLYELFTDSDTLDEPAFVDAVNMNLKNGRIVVLVIGDGIRSDVENLVRGLQSHAGFHFTFALVEFAVFQGSEENFFVVPRTLATTYMIERGIVRIDDQRGEVIAAPEYSRGASSASTQTITSEQFYEALSELSPELPGRLKAFIEKLSELGIYPEIKRSLIFRWSTPSGKLLNMGIIERNGSFLTSEMGKSSAVGVYMGALAKCFNGEVKQYDKGNGLVIVDGKTPHIGSLLDKQGDWLATIAKYQDQIREDIDREIRDE